MSSSRVILIISGIILYQAFVLAITDSADGSIAMNSIIRFFEGYRSVVPIFLFLAVVSSVLAVLINKLTDRFRILLLFPQQFILLIYAGGAIGAVIRESYADNVLRSWEFISSDQVFLIGIFVINSISITEYQGQR